MKLTVVAVGFMVFVNGEGLHLRILLLMKDCTPFRLTVNKDTLNCL